MRRLWYAPWTFERILLYLIGALTWVLARAGNKLIDVDRWLERKAHG